MPAIKPPPTPCGLTPQLEAPMALDQNLVQLHSIILKASAGWVIRKFCATTVLRFTSTE